MTVHEIENLILREIKTLVERIIVDNLTLNIPAKARAGAEISDWLEDKFVEYADGHAYFKDSQPAPKGQTKNPWDVKTFFLLDDILEEIWIDFKAIKLTGIDSNPDIGTPDKMIKFICQGNFYLAYSHVFYNPTADGLEFTQINGDYSKVYFLKDISPTFRRNPKNQLQVNVSAPSSYRTRAEFIALLVRKLKESHLRQIEISNRVLSNMDEVEARLREANSVSESRLIKKLEPISE